MSERRWEICSYCDGAGGTLEPHQVARDSETAGAEPVVPDDADQRRATSCDSELAADLWRRWHAGELARWDDVHTLLRMVAELTKQLGDERALHSKLSAEAHEFTMQTAKQLIAERDDLRAKLAAVSQEYADVAEAIGIAHVADGHPVVPGPVERIIEAVREDQRKASLVDELEAKLAEAEQSVEVWREKAEWRGRLESEQRAAKEAAEARVSLLEYALAAEVERVRALKKADPFPRITAEELEAK